MFDLQKAKIKKMEEEAAALHGAVGN